MKIAVDAMGGDNGHAVVVEGAVWATKELGVDLLLVGDEKQLSAELKKYDIQGNSIDIVHAPDKVEMHDLPSMVVRKKRNSSIWVGMSLVKEKKASAIVSAGNSGAVMATALFQLGRLRGVERPAIVTTLPTLKGRAVLLDIGANVDCKPTQLAQFAIMGYEYAKAILKNENLTVGLLSIGEEDAKGNELTREAFKLIKKLPLNFKGNIEGKDVFAGTSDIIVCDGFIGNVVLKVSEGLFDTFARTIQQELNSSIRGRIGAVLLKGVFSRFKDRFDYTEYGGAPLIGLNGVCVICHGRSPAKAIKNGIKLAKIIVENKINEHIQDDIEQNLSLFSQQQSSRSDLANIGLKTR